ncbi:MAG: tyrosine-protein phosphatase [Anaerolineae bacterium]|nr:tyrosine-protein phosphatase [Anaerolineae bacterium]
MPVLLALLAGVTAVGGGTYLGLQLAKFRRRRVQHPDPITLVTNPDTTLSLTRAESGTLELRWQGAHGPVQVYAGLQPDDIDRNALIASAEAGSSLMLGALTDRRYFEVIIGDHKPMLVAERVLPLASVANFRDAGGYPTADGRYVRWGRIYRSGSLGRLTAEDAAYLQALGVKMICDLRSAEEVSDEPDQLPQPLAALYRHEPLFSGDNSRERLRALLFTPGRLTQMLAETYTRDILEHNGPYFGDLLRRMADESNLPLLIHCTAGKDRTGVTVALLLLLLGVPEEIVIADYSLSNHYFTHFREVVQPLIRRIAWMGVTVDDLTPLLTAHPDNMRKMIDYLHEHYGTVERYLRERGGIDDTVIANLKAALLA